MRALLRIVFEVGGLDADVVEAESAPDALARWATSRPDLVVLDHLLPGPEGLEVATAMHEQRPEVPVVLFTAFLDSAIRDGARTAGVVECVTQHDLVGLSTVVRRHLDG